MTHELGEDASVAAAVRRVGRSAGKRALKTAA